MSAGKLPPLPMCHAVDYDANPGWKGVQLFTQVQMTAYGRASRQAALNEAANVCDSAGHHWSGEPAGAFFDAAEKIRNLK